MSRKFELAIRLFIFCIPIILSFASISYCAEWEYYDLDQDANFLYFDKSTTYDKDGVVYLWQKKVYHSDNLFRIRQVLGEKYYKLIEKLTLFEIHCPTRTFQERAFAYYDNNEKVIDYRYFDFVRDWKKIQSNTDMARLYWISCRSENKK